MANLRSPEAQYGSDQNGMVWGYRLIPGAPLVEVTSDAAVALLSSGDIAEGEFLWLHFTLANSSSEPWLRKSLDLPDTFYETFRGDQGSTRLEQGTDFLVALIHDVMFDFQFDPSAIAPASVYVDPRLVVSVRLKALRSVDRLRKAVRGGEIPRSSVDLIAHLLRDQAIILVDILRQSTARVDQIEDRLLANRSIVTRAELGALRRVLVRLQRLLAPEPAALFRLLSRPPEWIAKEDVADLRMTAEEFSTAVGDAGTLVERVKLLQEELAARIDEQTNRTLFVLTLVTVLALPINMIAGLLGMNVGGIPFAEHSQGFLVVVALLVGLTLLLGRYALRRWSP